ncbi:hypothetical protein SZ28_12090 [Burkholderia pseudomallei]|nr:hypothetical protein SZ28_12090 [Burkholderia pseudomallei]
MRVARRPHGRVDRHRSAVARHRSPPSPSPSPSPSPRPPLPRAALARPRQPVRRPADGANAPPARATPTAGGSPAVPEPRRRPRCPPPKRAMRRYATCGCNARSQHATATAPPSGAPTARAPR